MQILFVDDDEANGSPMIKELLERRGLASKFLHPELVSATDLQQADVVVVDYFLTSWDERDELESAARAPMDGLAVIATLRSGLLPGLSGRSVGARPPKPIAFVLWSGNLQEATFELPDFVLPGVFARENNLEWVFRRGDLSEETGANQLVVLASAMGLVQATTPRDMHSEEWLMEMLAVPKGPAYDELRADVLRCRPPLYDLASSTRGMSIVRWMLHRIMPYPCFLMDESEIAIRLRVENISKAQDLFARIEVFEYTGLLAGFAGRRWWRLGVERWLFDATEGNAGNSMAVAELALSLGALTEHKWMRPVATLSATFEKNAAPSEADGVVRIRPDDWPPYADDAYAVTSDVSDAIELRRIVEPADEYLVEESSNASAF
jgi:CheY-like chemotaxis protein